MSKLDYSDKALGHQPGTPQTRSLETWRGEEDGEASASCPQFEPVAWRVIDEAGVPWSSRPYATKDEAEQVALQSDRLIVQGLYPWAGGTTPTSAAAPIGSGRNLADATPKPDLPSEARADVPEVQNSIRDFFMANIGATRTECAIALGIDRRTVWKHLKRMRAPAAPEQTDGN